MRSNTRGSKPKEKQKDSTEKRSSGYFPGGRNFKAILHIELCTKTKIDTGFEVYETTRVRPYTWFYQKISWSLFFWSSTPKKSRGLAYFPLHAQKITKRCPTHGILPQKINRHRIWPFQIKTRSTISLVRPKSDGNLFFSFCAGRVDGYDGRCLVDNFNLWVKTSKMSYTSSFAPKKKWTPDLSFKDVHGSNHVVGSTKHIL